mmetsp:Transcript_19538/g.28108  ORF Transcript_19538/g.28108 Transcript_19538/m.28108 type:complete len:179 (+) Transcript_19538:16-552(+)
MMTTYLISAPLSASSDHPFFKHVGIDAEEIQRNCEAYSFRKKSTNSVTHFVVKSGTEFGNAIQNALSSERVKKIIINCHGDVHGTIPFSDGTSMDFLDVKRLAETVSNSKRDIAIIGCYVQGVMGQYPRDLSLQQGEIKYFPYQQTKSFLSFTAGIGNKPPVFESVHELLLELANCGW